MERVLLVTPEKCVGCGTCELACSFGKEGEFKPVASRIAVTRFERGQNVPMACFQCEDAACMNVCKTSALHRTHEGVVDVDKAKCIGCRMCVMACPFGNIVYNRAAKTVNKCDQCAGEPECAKFCPTKAIEYVPAETANLGRNRNFAATMAKGIVEVN